MESQWFVFYTKSRQEKKVEELLQKNGYDVFLPLQTVVRQWSDRKKKVVVPLFNSYIFVSAREHEIQSILQIPGIAWNIRLDSRPAILRNEELTLIKRFLDSGYFLESAGQVDNLGAGDRTIILDGPLKGIEGTVLKKSEGDSFFVVLAGIEQVIRVEIPAFLLKKL